MSYTEIFLTGLSLLPVVRLVLEKAMPTLERKAAESIGKTDDRIVQFLHEVLDGLDLFIAVLPKLSFGPRKGEK